MKHLFYLNTAHVFRFPSWLSLIFPTVAFNFWNALQNVFAFWLRYWCDLIISFHNAVSLNREFAILLDLLPNAVATIFLLEALKAITQKSEISKGLVCILEFIYPNFQCFWFLLDCIFTFLIPLLFSSLKTVVVLLQQRWETPLTHKIMSTL